MQDISFFFSNRNLQIDYWNSESRYIAAGVLDLEEKLTLLGKCHIQPVETLEKLGAGRADLFVIACPLTDSQTFPTWLSNIEKKLFYAKKIKTPTLIFADFSFETLNKVFELTLTSNWYCDLVNPKHIESLPIRIANLIRIHDHLKELEVYEKQISKLEADVSNMEKRLLTSPNSKKG